MNTEDNDERKRKRLEINKRKWKSQRRQLVGRRTNFSSQQRKRSQRKSNNLKSEAMKKFWQKKKELVTHKYEDMKSGKNDRASRRRLNKLNNQKMQQYE